MKILFLHALADPLLGGGAEVVLWEQIKGLQRSGHECVLLATSDMPGLKRSKQNDTVVWTAGIRNIYWPFHKIRPSFPKRLIWHAIDSYNSLMRRYIRKVLSLEQPDVVSVHNLPGWSSAAWHELARGQAPVMQTLHDYYPICVKSTMHSGGDNCESQCPSCHLFRMPHRTLSRRVDAVVGVSQFILDRHLALGYFRNVPVQQAIHNVRSGANLGIERILGDCAVRQVDAPLRFGYIGRLDPVKGVELLIQAFQTLDPGQAKLYIAGSGKQDYVQHLQQLIEHPDIQFMGRVPGKEFYKTIDVIVVPSVWNDNLPTVVFEAMAFGKPVIGSKRGGIPEMIQNDFNGLLFDPDRKHELIACLERLIHATDQVERMAGNAIVSSHKYLDYDKWIRSYESLYRKILVNRGSDYAR